MDHGIPIALAAGVAIGFAAHQPETVRVPTPATAQKQLAMDERAGKLDEQHAKHLQRVEDLDNRAADLDQRENELDDRKKSLDDRGKSLDEREARISHDEEVAAQNTVTDGVWTVGVDITPGTYRASDVSSDCYWGITASGSNGSEIIQNGIPGGGSPSVTLSAGQDFTSQRCGEWHKQTQ